MIKLLRLTIASPWYQGIDAATGDLEEYSQRGTHTQCAEMHNTLSRNALYDRTLKPTTQSPDNQQTNCLIVFPEQIEIT